ncbi:Gfo/Idh/MocA family oxidoreductase [Bacteroidota bacterium]
MTKRREFIKKSAMGTAGVAIGSLAFSSKNYASIIGANDRINVAVVGIGGRGGAHVGAWCSLKDFKNVTLKTLCDVDEKFFAKSAETVKSRTKVKPLTEWDMRRVFDDKEIDVVSFATPNHWHALGTVWACQAGKHVYVEKPASWSIWEGRKMIEAAEKYKVRVQVGFQNRSSGNVIEAIKLLHEGGIGDVYMARGLCIKPRDSFGIAEDSTPPATLHYDMWLGPVPNRPYNEKRAHYNWHWFWDTGNGDTGNQGPHQFDIARWGMNKNEHPVSVYSAGGYYGIDPKDCAQETPNTQSSVFKYSDGKMLEFETRGRFSNSESSLETKIGNIFYGSEGYKTRVALNGYLHRGAYDFYTGEEIWKMSGGGDIQIPTPILYRDLIFFNSAHGKQSPIYAIHSTAKGDLTLGEDETSNEFVRWSIQRGGSYMQTMLVYRELLYNANWNGSIVCFQAETGEEVWRNKAGSGNSYIASPVASDGKIYVIDDQGMVYILRAGSAYELLAQNDLGEICMVSPAISENTIFFRTINYMIAVSDLP